MATRVYKYGLIPISYPPQAAIDELFRANNLWNILVALHRESRENWDDARRAASILYSEKMDELEQKAGDYIAKLFGAEACYITSGAGSALTLTTAAFMAGDDDDLIVKLPDTTGMKDEILIQSRQRYHYERCLTYAGAKLIEFGNQNLVTSDDLEKSITKLDRQFLHAKTIGFNHPKNNERLEFTSKLPIDLEQILKKLRKIK